jgi:hypothetical protein
MLHLFLSVLLVLGSFGTLAIVSYMKEYSLDKVRVYSVLKKVEVIRLILIFLSMLSVLNLIIVLTTLNEVLSKLMAINL